MQNHKCHIVILLVIALLATAVVPATPVYAFSLTDLLGNASNSGTNSGTSVNKTDHSSSGGSSIMNILAALLLGNLLGKIFNVSDLPESSAGLPAKSTGSKTSGKEVVGFYAEWWGTDHSSFDSMSKNKDVIGTIAPFWATLNEDASVSDRGGNDHASVVNAAHKNNISTLLMVNNAKPDSSSPPIHTVLSDKALRSKAIDNIEAYIKQYHLDGVNIDFEMVPAQDRDKLSAFMQELYTRLKPQGYVVSIDVFPKQNENNDVSVAYDYAALAKYADKIMIMTYDNHGVWSKAGPIADISWVENNLKYALDFIPKNKIYLGIAAYGYDWSSKGVESLEYPAITNLIQKFGAPVLWDETSQSPHFVYTGPDGISHEVWYENSKSLQYKLDLVNKYDIAGVAVWKLGEEDPGYWQVFKDKLSLKK